ncbi:hypothetical protein IU486_32310 [Streptomyces gardneri]|nr:hypothetical protein [Streptomyces gardneri]
MNSAVLVNDDLAEVVLRLAGIEFGANLRGDVCQRPLEPPHRAGDEHLRLLARRRHHRDSRCAHLPAEPIDHLIAQHDLCDGGRRLGPRGALDGFHLEEQGEVALDHERTEILQVGGGPTIGTIREPRSRPSMEGHGPVDQGIDLVPQLAWT